MARDRPNEPSGFCTLRARRNSQRSRRTNRIVGPKPNSSVCHHRAPVSSGSALTVTSFSWRSRESSSVSANAGISVRNRVVGSESSYVSSFVNVPWTSVPLDVISSTLPAFTCCRKKGLYGTRTRDSGSMTRLVMKTLSARTATKMTIQRGLGLYHGRGASAGDEPRVVGGGVLAARSSAWLAIAKPYALAALRPTRVNTSSPSIARSLRTRSAIGGCVEKSVATPCRRSGLTM